MKLLIVVNSSMFDASLPLIRELRKKCELYCLFELNCQSTNLLPIDDGESGSIGNLSMAKAYSSLNKYSEYIPLNNSYVLKVTVPRNIFGFLKSINAERKSINIINPDYVYFYKIPDFAYSFVYGSQRHWGAAVHDPLPHSGENHLWKNNFLRKMVFKRCKSYFLFSESLVDGFVNAYKIPREQIHLTGLGPYMQLYYTNSASAMKKEHAGLNVFFFGRIEKYKGLAFLLKAYKKYIESERSGITLTIAGKGYIEDDIIDLYNTSGLIVKNRFIPEEELAYEIMTNDVVICPYTDATQSGVIMSAFAFCKPVVATRVGGLVEMVDDMQTGMLIEPSNEDSIFDALLYLEDNNSMIKEWSENIRKKYIVGDKSWNAIADKLLVDINMQIEDEL